MYRSGGYFRAMDRLVIFTDFTASFAPGLLRAFLAQLHARADATAVAVVTTDARSRATIFRTRVAWLLMNIFNPRSPARWPHGRGELARICRRHNIPLLIASRDDLTREDFRASIKERIRANVALSLGCLTVLPRELLDLFEIAVNCHNGMLPAYRGLRATDWAMYRGERRVGFAFHRMTAGVDEGDVLLTDSIPADPLASPVDLENRKTRLVCSRAADVITMMVRREAGVPQAGTPGYFGRRELAAIRQVGDPASVSWDDLLRRLRFFGFVFLNLGGETLPLSDAQIQTGRSPLHFTTKDGVTARATRLMHLPPALYRMARGLRLVSPPP